MAMPPSSVAFSEESPPPSFPTGVRAALRITVLGMGGTVACADAASPRHDRRPGTDARRSSSRGVVRRRRRGARQAQAAARRPTAARLDRRPRRRGRFDAERARVAAATVVARADGARARAPCSSCRRSGAGRRSSRARCSPPTASTRFKSETERRRAGAAARPHRGATSRRRAGHGRGAERRARPRQRARQRADADPARRRARASSPPSSGWSARCSAASRSATPGMGAFAAVAQGSERGAAADHAALRARGRDGPDARLRRQGASPSTPAASRSSRR